MPAKRVYPQVMPVVSCDVCTIPVKVVKEEKKVERVYTHDNEFV